jgi:SAM-dependent methyltransferase
VITAQEALRIDSLEAMLPGGLANLLEIGSRDGRVTRMLVAHSESVTALDLELPSLSIERVTCVKGDVTGLQFADESFDCVVCTEVLEHVPDLGAACRELARVTRTWLLVGVPFDQDLRIGRMTCSRCGRVNPRYGHVNRFTEERLRACFPSLKLEQVARLGSIKEATNGVSTWLFERSRNPWGTYAQQEPCMHCGAALTPPLNRTLAERLMAAVAVYLNRFQRMLARPKPIWIHCLFSKV